jgi:hypothetical protein
MSTFNSDEDISTLMTRFSLSRETVLAELYNNPESFAKLAYETNLFGYTKASRYFQLDAPICILGDHVNIQKLSQGGKVGVPYLMDVNLSDGVHRFVIKKSPFSPVIKFQTDAPVLNVCGCSFDIEGLRYIGSDEFTNETLIAYIIDRIFRLTGASVAGMNTYLKHELGYICNGQAYNLMEYADLGTLEGIGKVEYWNKYIDDGLQASILIKILRQVVCTLDLLHTQLRGNIVAE